MAVPQIDIEKTVIHLSKQQKAMLKVYALHFLSVIQKGEQVRSQLAEGSSTSLTMISKCLIACPETQTKIEHILIKWVKEAAIGEQQEFASGLLVRMVRYKIFV